MLMLKKFLETEIGWTGAGILGIALISVKIAGTMSGLWTYPYIPGSQAAVIAVFSIPILFGLAVGFVSPGRPGLMIGAASALIAFRIQDRFLVRLVFAVALFVIPSPFIAIGSWVARRSKLASERRLVIAAGVLVLHVLFIWLARQYGLIVLMYDHQELSLQ